jgi:hypothetical protein
MRPYAVLWMVSGKILSHMLHAYSASSSFFAQIFFAVIDIGIAAYNAASRFSLPCDKLKDSNTRRVFVPCNASVATTTTRL